MPVSRRRHRGMRLALLLALPVLPVLLAGCERENTLEGSLAEILDLSFTEVEVQKADDAVVIVYARKTGDARDTVLRVVVKAAAIEPGTEVALGEGAAEAAVSRAVAEDPVRVLPKVRRGTLVLDRTLEPGSPVSGEFRVTFGDGGDAGKGTTAFGTFKVAAAGLGNVN